MASFSIGIFAQSIAGGGPLTPGLADEARRRFGAKLATRYSCTEAGIGLGTQLAGAHAGVKQSAKGSPKREKFMMSYVQLLKAQMSKNNEVAVYQGAQRENMQYMAWLDKHIRAAGGAKSEAALLEMRQHAPA